MLSEARDGRDRADAASANVASAGVDGLLARPLFVVTVDCVVVGGGGSGGGIDESLFVSFSSVALSAVFSFLLPLGRGAGWPA